MNRIQDPYISQAGMISFTSRRAEGPGGTVPDVPSFRLPAKRIENLMQLCVPAAGGE